VRRPDCSLAMAVSAKSVGMASGVVWAKLWEGFLLRDCAQYHSSGYARGRAPDVVGTARSRSCWADWTYDVCRDAPCCISRVGGEETGCGTGDSFAAR
jgi:hypothetical protein